MFSSALMYLFVWQQDCTKKTTRPIILKFGRKVAYGPQKIPLAVGGSPVHVTLGLELGFLVEAPQMPRLLYR